MNIVRDLRNASAHSHCLINKLFEPLDISKQIDSNISIYIKNSVPNISKAARTKNLNYRVIYNFIVLLYTYNSVIPDGQIKSKRIKEIKDLFDNRLILHKDYFVSHNQIQAVYNFVKKIVSSINDYVPK